MFVHLHEPENSESQVQFGGRARLPPDWLILSQIWLVDSSLCTSHHLNPLHERSQHVAADGSLRLSGWSLFFIICIYMKINSFFPHRWRLCQLLITMWFTAYIWLGNRFLCCESSFGESRNAGARGQVIAHFMHIFKSPVTFWICHKTKSRSFAFSFP